MKRFLISDDDNGHNHFDPRACIYEINVNVPFVLFKVGLKLLESTQLGAGRSGGCPIKLKIDLAKLGIELNQVGEWGRLKDFKDLELDEYRLISGNY